MIAPHCCDCGQAIEGRGEWVRTEVAPNINVERLLCKDCAEKYIPRRREH